MIWVLFVIVSTSVQSYNLDIDIYGHRGGILQLVPEHTIASYALGAQQGADYLEPDVMLSKDGELIVSHDLDLSKTTDIALHPEFSNRSRTITIWGRGNPDNYTNGQPSSIVNEQANITGWFVHDFLLSELQTLRKISRQHPIDSPLNGMWSILTFNESLQITHNLSKILDRPLGIIPETKFAEWFNHIGFEGFEYKVLESLKEYGFVYEDDDYYKPFYMGNETDQINRSSVILQSFAAESLRRFDELTNSFIPTMFLMGSSDFDEHELQDDGVPQDVIEWIVSFADIIACPKSKLQHLVDARERAYGGLKVDIGCYTSVSDVNEYIKFIEEDVSVFSNDVSTGRVVRDVLKEAVKNDSVLATFCEDMDRDVIRKIEMKWAVIGGVIALISGGLIGALVFYGWYRYKLNKVTTSSSFITSEDKMLTH
eukprot:220286_1